MSVTYVSPIETKTHLDPFLLFFGEHVVLDHLGLDGHACEALEAKESGVVETLDLLETSG